MNQGLYERKPCLLHAVLDASLLPAYDLLLQESAQALGIAVAICLSVPCDGLVGLENRRQHSSLRKYTSRSISLYIAAPSPMSMLNCDTFAEPHPKLEKLAG